MSKKIKVFYDYTCPFCYKGLKELGDILPDYKTVGILFGGKRLEYQKVQ